MMFKTSIGIEVAGKDVRFAILCSTFGKLRLVHTEEIPNFLEMTVEDRKSTVNRIVKRHNLSPNRVHLSLPREKGIVRQLEFPVEIREKLKSVVSLQLEDLSPWPANEVYWDFSHDVPKKGAKTVRVTVTMIPRATLDEWVDFFKLVKLPLSGASLSSVTWAHGINVLWPGDTPTIVLHCDPLHIEAALVCGSQVSSLGQPVGDINGGAKAAVERLVALGRIGSVENARLLVYGSASSSLEKLERVAVPLENAKPETSDRFGAIASALAGLRKSVFAANLIPFHDRYRRSRLQLIPTYALLVFAVVLGLLLMGREPYQMMRYAARIDAEIRQIAPAAREVSNQQGELNKLSEKYRALSVHLESRDYNLETLREFARVLPPTAWLATYSYQDRAVTISGIADSATEVQKLLEDSALFKDVQFTGNVNKDSKSKDRFTLKAVIEVRQ